MKQRTVLFSRRLTRKGYTGEPQLLHVETEGAIVNIRIGLHHAEGNQVTSVEIIPDPNTVLDGWGNSRIIFPAEQGV